ncbi:hypothetical protein CA13_42290 [Planctomycetes bacterium CA13]|uniref:Uncharacterized protein n=1 Tax=Novipirellula herctigrandis TaxID=2527986 RepID=A0A5C5Z6P2_9BACT|nr:hypothetical protein CA13_42290 [Planctomycetes bacterium CA13]
MWEAGTASNMLDHKRKRSTHSRIRFGKRRCLSLCVIALLCSGCQLTHRIGHDPLTHTLCNGISPNGTVGENAGYSQTNWTPLESTYGWIEMSEYELEFTDSIQDNESTVLHFDDVQ